MWIVNIEGERGRWSTVGQEVRVGKNGCGSVERSIPIIDTLPMSEREREVEEALANHAPGCGHNTPSPIEIEETERERRGTREYGRDERDESRNAPSDQCTRRAAEGLRRRFLGVR